MPRPGSLLALAVLLACSACQGVSNARFSGAALPDVPAPGFTLTDDRGTPWTLAQQRGNVVALFFGYTHCADTCPATLAKLASAIGAQGAAGAGAEIAFVTVDPQRDTPAVLAKYVKRFDGAKIVGLTGSAAGIANVERAYHVWAQKIPGRKGDDDYDDAHSSVVYLIDRNGHQRVLHNDDDSPASFAADLRELLR